jgi:biopolymer transport protein ExbD
MFRRRHREQIPELNTTSTADISFMLLIFFLVTSSMDTDKGLMRQLPPPPQEEQAPTDIQQEHVLTVTLDANDQLACDGTLLTLDQLTEQVMAFVAKNPEEHVISVQTDRQTSYDAYYHMQNAIVAAYNRLRAQGGADAYPMRISEQEPTKGGGR